jgi:hypothetical protein
MANSKPVTPSYIELCLRSIGSEREKYVLKPNNIAKADVWKHFMLGKL